MKNLVFQVKLSRVFIALTVAILLVTTYFIYQKSILQQKEELRGRISILTRLASLLIDADRHSQIKPEMESQATALYREIKGVLKKIKEIDPLVDSVYTMVKTDRKNIWVFVLDTGDKKWIIAYCRERYDVSQMPEMRMAFDGPIVDREPTADKWGMWLSGYAPIYNRLGQAMAIVGLDISAKSIRQVQLLLFERFAWIFILGIVLSLFMSRLLSESMTSSLRHLIMGVREVGRGNFNHKVNIKSKDEIGELAGAFNKMTEGILEAQGKLQQFYLETIKSLARALEAKDSCTVGHSERVANYAVNIARRLALSDKEIKLLENLCILHDIGKIGVPEGVLSKPEALSEEEWKLVRMHPEIGEDILKDIELLKPGLTIISDHHERPDGKGYPNALKEEEISLLASIVAVADAFDAMTSDRSYRKAIAKDEAIAIIKKNTGSQFSSRVVGAFIEYSRLEGWLHSSPIKGIESK